MLLNSNTVNHKRIFRSKQHYTSSGSAGSLSGGRNMAEAGLRASYLVALILWILVVAGGILSATHRTNKDPPTNRQWNKMKNIAKSLENLLTASTHGSSSSVAPFILSIRDAVESKAKWDATNEHMLAIQWLALQDDPKHLSIQRYAVVVLYFSTNVADTWKLCCATCDAEDCYDSASGKGAEDGIRMLTSHRHECDWYGLTCDPSNQAIRWIDWTDNGLGNNQNAMLPIELTLLSDSLEALWWSENPDLQIFQLPSWISELTRLQSLSLYHNPGLAGTIPSELYRMTQLESLRLYDTNLGGTISTEGISKLTKLSWLWIQNNHFMGTLDLHGLRELEGLAVHGNHFENDSRDYTKICESLSKLSLFWVDCSGATEEHCPCCTKCFHTKVQSKDI